MGGCGFLLVTGEDMHSGFSRQEIARGAITMQPGRQTGQQRYECSRCGRMCHPTATSAYPKTRQSVLLVLCIVQTSTFKHSYTKIHQEYLKTLLNYLSASDCMNHV